MSLNNMTLEELLRIKVKSTDKDNNEIKITPDFKVAVQDKKEDKIHFIIHPLGHSGETIDFVVKGNELKYLVEEKGDNGTLKSAMAKDPIIKNDPRIVKIERWAEVANQHCVWESSNKKWSCPALHILAKDLPVQEMPLSGINLISLGPKIDNCMLDFVGHMRMVLEADLSYPIILDSTGDIMDGRHRVAKALLMGLPTIKFVRFVENPEPSFEGEIPKEKED